MDVVGDAAMHDKAGECPSEMKCGGSHNVPRQREYHKLQRECTEVCVAVAAGDGGREGVALAGQKLSPRAVYTNSKFPRLPGLTTWIRPASFSPPIDSSSPPQQACKSSRAILPCVQSELVLLLTLLHSRVRRHRPPLSRRPWTLATDPCHKAGSPRATPTSGISLQLSPTTPYCHSLRVLRETWGGLWRSIAAVVRTRWDMHHMHVASEPFGSDAHASTGSELLPPAALARFRYFHSCCLGFRADKALQ